MIGYRMKAIVAALATLLATTAAASAFETAAKQVIIVDYATGSELFAKNADEIMEPASMTKMMTIYMLFDRLKSGSLTLKDTFLVSENAWRMTSIRRVKSTLRSNGVKSHLCGLTTSESARSKPTRIHSNSGTIAMTPA